jgi:hypothetical protein
LFREGILSRKSQEKRNMRKETCEEKEQRHGNKEREQMHVDRWRIPKERDPLLLMSKGESEKH